MCRLFGFRSVLESQVHSSLVAAENALGVQSQAHPDGWGVAYYVAGTPHVIKSSAAAFTDGLFSRVSGVVSSNTVLAHVRRASVGEVNLLNSHPFQFGRWVFAHNGEVVGFSEVKDTLRARIEPSLWRYRLGDTDSEVVFFVFLSALLRRTGLHAPLPGIEPVADSLRETIEGIVALSEQRGLERPRLTTVVTDGTVMVASCLGRELHRSTWKRHCPERDACGSYAPACETPQPDRRVSHFIVSSEPLQGQNVWERLPDGAFVGCDGALTTYAWGAAGTN